MEIGIGKGHVYCLALLGAWWLSRKVGTLQPEGRRFESPSSLQVGTVGRSYSSSQFTTYLFNLVCPPLYLCLSGLTFEIAASLCASMADVLCIKSLFTGTT